MKLTEITKTEVGEIFKVNGWSGEFMIDSKDTLRHRQSNCHEWEYPCGLITVSIIKSAPKSITKISQIVQLDKEQEKILMAFQTLGYHWMVKHDSGLIVAYENKPVKIGIYWAANVGKMQYGFVDSVLGKIDCLLSSSSTEPFDIVKTLDDQGM